MKIKKLKYALAGIFLTLFGAAIIIYPERYVTKCFEGFALWAECVLPSLFPFMVIALIFIKTGMASKAALPLQKLTRPFNLPPPAAVCFVLSAISGYPAGSRTVAEFYSDGELDGNDCKKLAPLCSTSGPLFIIGSVGFKMFGDKTLGMKLFVAHIAAVLAIGLIYCRICKKSGNIPAKPRVATENILYECFYGAVISVAVAGGFIAFFYVLAQFLRDFYLFAPLEWFFKLFLDGAEADALCAGLAEVTTGCRLIAAAPSARRGALAGFVVTFGGASVLAQQLGYLSRTGVSAAKFVFVKFLQAVLCALIMLAIT